MVGNTSRIIAILATVLCAATLDQIPISKVVYVSKKMSWDDAHDHCKTHHSDMVAVKDQNEAKDLALLGGWVHLSPSYKDLLFKLGKWVMKEICQADCSDMIMLIFQ